MLNAASQKNLKGVHDDLKNVVVLCDKQLGEGRSFGFVVTEGLRSAARQQQLLQEHATTTLWSRHLTGHAVDLAVTIDGKVHWDWPLYPRLDKAMQAAAAQLGIPLEWGGSWRVFKDGCHWQLPWKKYP